MRHTPEQVESRKNRTATRRAEPWRRRRPLRRPWLVVLVTALLCAGIWLLVFSAVHRRARISASYGGSPAHVREDAEGADGSLFRRLEWKEGQFVLVQYGPYTSTELDTGGFTDPSTKNGHDLAEWAEMAWKNQWGYVWGTFGQVMTEDLLAGRLEQYPDVLEQYKDQIREKWMGRRVADCAGLIKGYGWYDPASDAIAYGTGGMPDVGADDMWDAAQVKGGMDTMPDQPGLLVYSTAGHIGVYVGDGWAVEAISHAGGVVKTRVADRPWTGWLQCPYIRYDP